MEPREREREWRGHAIRPFGSNHKKGCSRDEGGKFMKSFCTNIASSLTFAPYGSLPGAYFAGLEALNLKHKHDGIMFWYFGGRLGIYDTGNGDENVFQ